MARRAVLAWVPVVAFRPRPAEGLVGLPRARYSREVFRLRGAATLGLGVLVACTPRVVTLHDGVAALKLAHQILKEIEVRKERTGQFITT